LITHAGISMDRKPPQRPTHLLDDLESFRVLLEV
jgi:hypothetical protein